MTNHDITHLSFRRTLALYFCALSFVLDSAWIFFTLNLFSSCLFHVAVYFTLLPSLGRDGYWPLFIFTIAEIIPLSFAYNLITPPRGLRPNLLPVAFISLFSFALGFVALYFLVYPVSLKYPHIAVGVLDTIFITSFASGLLSLLLNWVFIFKVLSRFNLYHLIVQIPQKLRHHVQETILSGANKRARLEAAALNSVSPPDQHGPSTRL